MKNYSPQDGKKIRCNKHEKDYVIEDPNMLVSNEALLELTPDKIDSIVVCTKHPTKEVEYYC
jgi:hypothetical protein